MPVTRSLRERNRASERVVRTAAVAALLLLGGCGNNASAPTYKLGGTVSGLQGSGLVLANHTRTLAVSAGAVSFNFGPVLTSGASYTVTVQAQPAGQSCTIANGSGAAMGASVSNVVVTCSQLASGLGGTLAGLTVSGLVLANGGDTLSVPADATTFTMPAPVATGSSYAVTVQTQPAGESCAVTGGAGTMPASAVATVAVSCTDQPFNLGGSITGLTAGGLVLGNGTDVRTVASGATSFTMPMKVTFGSVFAVLVKTQPAGLTCTVSNGSGNMPANNVTQVAVACADRSYALGGSVSGLSAGGLILANGNDTLTVPAGAAGFTMPTSVAYGSSYAVTVQAQPAGLLCTVSSGTGTMPANNFVGVTVVCGVTTYTVGGSINGLTSSGLVLMNGSDVLTVAANAASFTMPTGAASGSTYAVTVQTQPSGQLCTVNNGSGTVAGSDVNSVQVTCGARVINFTAVGAATWTVPSGVTSIQVVATGGGGGGGGGGQGYNGGALGGNGGVVTVTLAVNAGDVVNLNVGGGGGSGGYGVAGGFGGGGGGGGSTNVNISGSSTQIIAGGAGGGFGDNSNGYNGGDGNGGNSGPYGGGYGGANGIGGAPGSNMGMGGSQGVGGNGNGGPGGDGGANGGAIAGGLGGAGMGSGSGGINAGNCAGGGGGGYGGGGGGSSNGGGGGGGSTGPAGAVFSLAANGGGSAASGGDGSVVITVIP